MKQNMCHGYHILSKEPLTQAKIDDDLHGSQRSSEVKKSMCYGYHIWSKELLMQVKNDDDLHGGQRSTEVKYGKLCYMAIKLGHINRWCKFRMMGTFVEVKGQQRSNIGKQWSVATKFSQKICWYKLRMIMTFTAQRSTVNKGHNNK